MKYGFNWKNFERKFSYSQNIFGSDPDNIRHRKITLANFSNNEIRSFGAQTFIGMPRVEYFYLRNNLLEAVDFADVPPLNYLTSLKLLDLHHVFGTKLSSKGRAQLLKTLLTCNHSMIDLQQLIISQNGLEYIEPDTFCHVCFKLLKNIGFYNMVGRSNEIILIVTFTIFIYLKNTGLM